MKKLFGILLAVVMVFSVVALVACGPKVTYEIAMITDSGDITDKSFNQTTWEAVKAYGEENEITYNYYKPTADTTAARVEKIEEAISRGAKVVVMPGFLFAGAVVETSKNYPDTKFVVIDCSEDDYMGAIKAIDKEGKLSDYIGNNVYSIVFQEEQAGYLAGYAAVKDGETNLGFLGGIAVPAVIRFGYGYIQGAADAAAELKIKVNMWYGYGGQFFGSPEIKSVMDTWFAAGVETVFASGGGIYSSVVEAINTAGHGQLIGVDSDQSLSIKFTNTNCKVLTSAMKGLADATKSALDIFYSDAWNTVGGKIVTLGLKAGETQEYVGLPTAEGSWNFKTFSLEDYRTLVAGIRDGSIEIDNSTDVDIQDWINKNANLTLKAYEANIIGGGSSN